MILNNLGATHHSVGNDVQALRYVQAGLAVHLELGDRWTTAFKLHNLGKVHRDAGRHDLARRSWLEAAAILEDLVDPVAARHLRGPRSLGLESRRTGQ